MCRVPTLSLSLKIKSHSFKSPQYHFDFVIILIIYEMVLSKWHWVGVNSKFIQYDRLNEVLVYGIHYAILLTNWVFQLFINCLHCEDDKTVGVAIIKSKGHYIGRSYPQIGKDVYFCSPECNFYILYVFMVLQLPRSNQIFYMHSRCTNS